MLQLMVDRSATNVGGVGTLLVNATVTLGQANVSAAMRKDTWQGTVRKETEK